MQLGRVAFGPPSKPERGIGRHFEEACEIIADLIEAVNSGKEKLVNPEIERANEFLNKTGRGKK